MTSTENAPAERAGEGGHETSGPSCADQATPRTDIPATRRVCICPVDTLHVTNDVHERYHRQARHTDAVHTAALFLATHPVAGLVATHIDTLTDDAPHIRWQLRPSLATLAALADTLATPAITARRDATATTVHVTGTAGGHTATAWTRLDEATTDAAARLWHALSHVPAVGTTHTLPPPVLHTAAAPTQEPTDA